MLSQLLSVDIYIRFNSLSFCLSIGTSSKLYVRVHGRTNQILERNHDRLHIKYEP